MDKKSTYNGWTNYETWCVHLWLTNDAGSNRYWSDQAAVHLNEAGSCDQVECGICTRKQVAIGTLASELKESFEQSHPFHGDHLDKPRTFDVFTDLLDAALSEVEWDEVAKSFLDYFEPPDDNEPDEDGEGIDDEDREGINFEGEEKTSESLDNQIGEEEKDEDGGNKKGFLARSRAWLAVCDFLTSPFRRRPRKLLWPYTDDFVTG